MPPVPAPLLELPESAWATGLFDGLLPDPVAVSEFAGEAPYEVLAAGLFPAERAHIARAFATRRHEFAAVRACARAAMTRIGLPPFPVLPHGEGPTWARNAPRWPAGVLGSMTHCAGFRAAALTVAQPAVAGAVVSLGIDAEPNAPLPEGVRSLALGAEEERALAPLAARRPDVAWDRVVFSAKESVYKAWYPLTGRWLGFDQCRITFDPEGDSFTADLTVPGPLPAALGPGRVLGRWRALTGGPAALVGTAVTVPAAG